MGLAWQEWALVLTVIALTLTVAVLVFKALKRR
jgi:hypothetical protein